MKRSREMLDNMYEFYFPWRVKVENTYTLEPWRVTCDA